MDKKELNQNIGALMFSVGVIATILFQANSVIFGLMAILGIIVYLTNR